MMRGNAVKELLMEVNERKTRLLKGGSQKEIDKQHGRGKLTARERIGLLFDVSSFTEFDLWMKPLKTGFDIDHREVPGDAVITGYGDIEGRRCLAYSHDFTIAGGTFGSAFHHKVSALMRMAIEKKLPIIQIIDSGGERVYENFGKTAARPILGGRFPGANTMTMYSAPGRISGVVPQITVMLGPMYAGSAYIPTMADFMIMRNNTSFMSVASPQLLKAVTSQEVTQEQIGGAKLHASTTGSADFLVETDEEAMKICKELISFLPTHYTDEPPVVNTGDDPRRREESLIDIVEDDAAYDMHNIIRRIVDKGIFLELQSMFAKSMIIGFARLNGHSVGIVANNPMEEGGVLTIDTCDKESRFIRFCDAFNIPLIFLVDTEGFSKDVNQERSREGLVRTACKPVFAICEATVPMISVHIGKCFGESRLAMGGVRMGIDISYSWPCAKVARIDPKEAAKIIYKKELDSSSDRDRTIVEKENELVKDYFRFPYQALELGMINDLIDPADTRYMLINALQTLAKKEPIPSPWRKHSLMPQ